MATAKQIQYRVGQAKKKLTKLNKEVTAAKGKLKKLEADLKKAKAKAEVAACVLIKRVLNDQQRAKLKKLYKSKHKCRKRKSCHLQSLGFAMFTTTRLTSFLIAIKVMT